MRVRTKAKGGWVNHNQTMARDSKAPWIKKGLVRLCVSAAAVAGFLALSGPALAGSAYMSEIWDGQMMRGYVIYQARPSELNEVTISMPSSTKLVIRDQGIAIEAWWGWPGSYGCWNPEISEQGGAFPATCEHPNGISLLKVWLGDRSDRLTIDASVASSVTTNVYGEAGNDVLTGGPSADWFSGGDGDDELDTRGGSTKDTVHCGDGIDWVFVDPNDVRGSGCETESFGGVLTSGPAVASWALDQRLVVLWRDAGNYLWSKWYIDGYGWYGDTSLGQFTSDPAALDWDWGFDLFWRGTGNDLRSTSRIGSPSLGGYLTSDPAVASWGEGRLDVFVRGSGNFLYQKFYDGGAWSGWVAFYDGELTSDPAAVSWGWGRIDVFWRGTDFTLRHKFFDGVAWSAVESLGGYLTSGPAVASRGPDKLDVFVRGTDNALYRLSYDGEWSGWVRLGGRLTSDPAAVSWGDGRIDVFMRGPDYDLYHLWLP